MGPKQLPQQPRQAPPQITERRSEISRDLIYEQPPKKRTAGAQREEHGEGRDPPWQPYMTGEPVNERGTQVGDDQRQNKRQQDISDEIQKHSRRDEAHDGDR